MGQQNSPVPSPYTPQSPAPVSGQLPNAPNHHSDRHGTDDYLNIVQRLGNEVRLVKSWIQLNFLQPNLAARLQQQQAPQQTGGAGGLQPPSSPYDEAELDALAEIERIEREAASEKCSKEVQDKGGPGAPTGAPGSGSTGGANAGKLTPQEATAAGNGASRPPLMVSIDLQQAGRADGQLDPCLAAPIPALEAQRWPEEPASGPAAVEGSDTALQLKPDGRPDVIKNRVDKHDSRREGRESSKHRHHDKSSDRRGELPKPSNRGEHGRDRDRESDRDRRHRSETSSRDRRSPDSRSRSDRDRSGFQASSTAEPGRSSSRQDGSKAASSSTGAKIPDSFPAQLLGGHTGALKNFQIPKVIWADRTKYVPVYQSFSCHCLQSHTTKSFPRSLLIFVFPF
ncbi:hypothetical protein XENOCAPTIV_003806 [Xenoophorus captivus]|uniref:Uncharacterized protein n=1 Tax=Xenoophorus captivus TaxID=1517983 RepID=A0ABV0QL86_9TELE